MNEKTKNRKYITEREKIELFQTLTEYYNIFLIHFKMEYLLIYNKNLSGKNL